jgi:hypothetical protein
MQRHIRHRRVVEGTDVSIADLRADGFGFCVLSNDGETFADNIETLAEAKQIALAVAEGRY